MRYFFAFLLIAICITADCNLLKVEASNRPIDEKKVDEIVEQGMRNYDIPGLSLGIVKGDRVVYLKGYGVADDSGREVTPQTPFMLGSVSKSFTALAVMQLAEQGKIDLDTAVRRYLPELRLEDPGGARQVTVRDLLNQTSGISTYDGRDILTAGNQSLEEVVRRQSNLRLTKPAGTAFQYSNTNYILLGEIVRRISGLDYEQYIEDRIFDRLDMRNSFTRKSEAETNGLASGYQSVFGKMISTDPKIHRSSVPAGYIISSAEDMTHYVIAQMNGGTYLHAAVISSEGMKAMHQSSAVFPYGMGWFTDARTISHGGDTENFHSDVIMIPESEWAIVVLMNTNDALKTKLYGNVYEQLSYRIMNVVSDGELFFMGIPEPTEFGNVDLYANSLFILVSLWIVWSTYGLIKMRSSYKGITLKFVIVFLATVLFHIVLPLAVIVRVPKLASAPWGTIFNYMPGIGHALMFFSLALLLIGLMNIYLRMGQIRKGYSKVQ
ncbi:serine hydrolase domain-containing protein [Cohnella cholangitidis]|uniref:Beta-lactamase family protein n=1 Tax=Cohnella cholangitidis TaxID=2598458 RepID=A0A7G5C4M6_9BACL|nr:serine hydrolase domain-containing protein [Cohnella cholangitidis]QMV44160.1 beta-lactamase family protein [Cohnella cholangitidis]